MKIFVTLKLKKLRAFEISKNLVIKKNCKLKKLPSHYFPSSEAHRLHVATICSLDLTFSDMQLMQQV